MGNNSFVEFVHWLILPFVKHSVDNQTGERVVRWCCTVIGNVVRIGDEILRWRSE